MDGEQLIAIGRRLARPIARLVAEPHGDPVGAWLADDEHSAPTRVRVDIRSHPDPSCRRPGALQLDADGEDAEARLVRARRVGADEVSLYALPAIDPPCLDLVLRIAGEEVRRWLDETGSTPEAASHPSFAGAAIAREYDAWWWRTTAWRAEDVYAQLGGWPITWPDEPAADQLRAPLALRTYRGAEPWLEVFWQRPVYVVRARAT